MAAKAYGTLERSCARCHQAGRLEGAAPSTAISNILALDEVARDPSLVRPGVPDASRIYNIALTRELHHDIFNDPAVPEPSTLDVQALRDWIAELPLQASAACGGREQVPAEHVAASVATALAALEPERARQTRFVSLAHLHNACVSDAELERLRAGLGSTVERLAPQGSAAGMLQPLVAADAERLVYAISLTGLGWRGEQWEKLTALHPARQVAAMTSLESVRSATGTLVPTVHADWFAHAVQRALSGAFETPEGTQPAAAQLWGLAGPQALAHAWRRPADIRRAAADLELPIAELRQRLAGVPVEVAMPARQLLGGEAVRRVELDRLYAVFAGTAAPVAALPDRKALEIALLADSPSYSAGDPAYFTVLANRDCYLTLIGVDRGGRATVLFPNELEPANRVLAGRIVRVPAETAPYRFRFKEKGRETIVAICSESHKSPDGVTHDYDRLRFTVLGDWQLFLREPPEMGQARRDDAATDVPRPQVRQRRRGRAAEPKAEQGTSGPDVQTRTAIPIDIE